MNKTILISIITSNILFGATVSSSTFNQTSVTDGGTTIVDANVSQAATTISGSAVVDGLTITQNATGNHIDGASITGIDPTLLTVSQGTTIITDSNVKNVTLDSDNTIQGGSINGVGEVSQGKTTVTGGTSVLENVKTVSDNKILGATINNSIVTQSTLVVSDANATDTSASAVDIKSMNTIDGGATIENSALSQSNTELTNGSTVSGLNIDQINVFTNASSATNGSLVIQGLTSVNDNSNVNGLKQVAENDMSSTVINNSVVGQAGILVSNQSTLDNADLTQTNKMTAVTATNAIVGQAGILVDDSEVNNLTENVKNTMTNVTATDAIVTQNALAVLQH